MRWLMVLLLIPTVSACSLMYAPYSGLSIAEDAFVTTGTAEGLLVNLDSGGATDLELDFFAKALIKADGTRILTFHQEGLGADCSGTTYIRLLDGDGAKLDTWQVDGPLYAWDDGFFAGEPRDWDGNPSTGPTWDHEWGDVLTSDGTAWARYEYYEKTLAVTGQNAAAYTLAMDYPRLALNTDGSVVAAVENNGGTVSVSVRSLGGPNWDWTLETEGEYFETDIAIHGNMVGVAAHHAYRLNLETGAAHRLDTDLEAKSVGQNQQLGWLLSTEDGNSPMFVGSTTRAKAPFISNAWLETNAPAWVAAENGEVVLQEAGPIGSPTNEAPMALPFFGLLAFFWLARKV